MHGLACPKTAATQLFRDPLPQLSHGSASSGQPPSTRNAQPGGAHLHGLGLQHRRGEDTGQRGACRLGGRRQGDRLAQAACPVMACMRDSMSRVI